RNSPSATASPPGNHPAAAATTTPPTRRVTCAKVRCCVGGVITPPCGVPSSVGEYPFPASKIPALSQPAIISLAGKPPIALSRCSWPILSKEPPTYYVLR